MEYKHILVLYSGDLDDVNTTGATNGQVLTKKSTGYEFDDIPDNSHDLVDEDGTTMTKRSALQVKGGLAHLSDDSTNQRTVFGCYDGQNKPYAS